MPWLEGDPTDAAYKLGTQHGANRLAAIGIAGLCLVPIRQRGHVQVAVSGRRSDRGFSIAWPIWRAPVSLSTSDAQKDLAGHPRVSEALHLIDAWLEAEQAYERLPALSVAVATSEGVLWSSGYGFADVERRIPVESGTQYSGCSIAKLFTATAVMQLVERGKLVLDDPAAKHLPWLPQTPSPTPITVRHLLLSRTPTSHATMALNINPLAPARREPPVQAAR